jgi:diacylglycerol kinase family enzyme
MKNAKILHNPNAGSQEHTKKKLISLIESTGVDCGYSSTKEIGWKKMNEKTDILVIAGGDGTVRKVIVKFLHRNQHHIRPVLLLPLGTANNIAKSLGIEGHIDEIVRNLDKRKLKKFDVGRISGRKKEMVFIESFGFGVFPELMKTMKALPESEDATPEENLKTAQEHLHRIIMKYPAKAFTITIDGTPNTDHYLLIEIMNTSSIGPNLNLSPDSDPGDGEFEMVLIPESQRDEFASYISDKLRGIEKEFKPIVIKGKKISITAPAGDLHIDDQLKTIKKEKNLTITPIPGMLEFFVQ